MENNVYSCSCGCSEFTTISGCELSFSIIETSDGFNRVLSNLRILDDISNRTLICKSCNALFNEHGIASDTYEEEKRESLTDSITVYLTDIFTSEIDGTTVMDIAYHTCELKEDYVYSIDCNVTFSDGSVVNYVGRLVKDTYISNKVNVLNEESVKKQMLYKMGYKNNSLEFSDNKELIIQFIIGNHDNIFYSKDCSVFFIASNILDVEVA